MQTVSLPSRTESGTAGLGLAAPSSSISSSLPQPLPLPRAASPALGDPLLPHAQGEASKRASAASGPSPSRGSAGGGNSSSKPRGSLSGGSARPPEPGEASGRRLPCGELLVPSPSLPRSSLSRTDNRGEGSREVEGTGITGKESVCSGGLPRGVRAAVFRLFRAAFRSFLVILRPASWKGSPSSSPAPSPPRPASAPSSASASAS
mmetsp:Transcript_73859/g.233276  ORF Transcript_73859/g.233276 Transcript_73859/m.233276 type:complete len:206 (-) Transcript_73859:1206-1823(-)